MRGVCSGNPRQGSPTRPERRWGQQGDASQLSTACSVLWDTGCRFCLVLHMLSLQWGPEFTITKRWGNSSRVRILDAQKVGI